MGLGSSALRGHSVRTTGGMAGGEQCSVIFPGAKGRWVWSLWSSAALENKVRDVSS